MADPIISTRNLSKYFNGKFALNNLTFDIYRGGIHAIVGSNGAGKSTLFRLLLGLMEPSCGESRVLSCNSRALTPSLRGRIGFVNEEHTLPEWMTVSSVKAMQQQLYPGWQEHIYHEVLSNFDVRPGQRVSELSRGERAGFNLSLALAQSPELLILDEPTLGLDVVAKRAFLEALLFVGTDCESTVIYCSHQMEEIERVADNLLIMEQGSVTAISPPDEFRERVGYWIVEFTGHPPTNAEIPGLLQSRKIDGQHHLMVIDAAPRLHHFLNDREARVLSRQAVGLDQAVNAYLAKNHRGYMSH